jgi:hypothetical protein
VNRFSKIRMTVDEKLDFEFIRTHKLGVEKLG